MLSRVKYEKNNITNIEGAAHTKYIDIELVYLIMCRKFRKI